MKRWKRSAVFTGITLLLLAAGLFLLALAPQCAGVRFVLLDRIIAGQESLDWTETAADAAAMTLEEVLALCRLDDRLLPCIDFGHLNARTLGSIRGAEDYERILLTMKT